mgnify:FL=1
MSRYEVFSALALQALKYMTGFYQGLPKQFMTSPKFFAPFIESLWFLLASSEVYF